LYFLSYREFDPVYDNLHFDLVFPRGVKPYLVTLRKDIPSPFIPVPKPPEEKEGRGESQSGREEGQGGGNRFRRHRVPHPGVSGGRWRYQQIAGIRGKVLFTSLPIEGSLHGDNWPPPSEPQGKATLEVFDFETQKAEELVEKMSYFVLSGDRRTLVYRAGRRLRVLKGRGETRRENWRRNRPQEGRVD